MEDYISMMQRNENMCMSYILKAEQERQRNNGLPSKAECVYLQEAAKIRAEMARISVGAEKQHQENQKKELDARIRRLVLELSPYYAKMYRSLSCSSSPMLEKMDISPIRKKYMNFLIFGEKYHVPLK